jgi:hypothetical protein
MLRRPRSYPTLLAALAAMVAFAAGPALADVSVTRGSGNGLVATIDGPATNVHFTYTLAGCTSIKVPCYRITAGYGSTGTPVSAAAGGCTAQSADSPPSVIECPAAGVISILFLFKGGGTWAAYEGGGGQHSAGPCSPAPVTVETGPPGPIVSVESWNACTETVICSSTVGVLTGVDADAGDTVRGPCFSIVRH